MEDFEKFKLGTATLSAGGSLLSIDPSAMSNAEADGTAFPGEEAAFFADHVVAMSVQVW